MKKISPKKFTQKSRNFFKQKIMQPLHTKKHAINLSTKKLVSEWVSEEWEKSRYLSTQKITQPLDTKNRATSSHKKSRKLSTTKTYVKVVTVGTVVTVVTKKLFSPKKCFHQKTFFFTKKKLFHTKNQATPSHKKSCHLFTHKKSHNLSTKNHATSPQKNHTTFRKINHSTNTTSPHTKSRNLSTNEIMQPVHQNKTCNLSTKNIARIAKRCPENITTVVRCVKLIFQKVLSQWFF